MTQQPFPQDREFTRVPVLMSTTLTTDTNQVSEGHVHDICARGVLYAGDPMLSDGSLVKLEIFPQGRTEGFVIRARGRIERCTPFGHGVEFIEIDAESWEHLQKLIYLHAENPDRVRAEFESHHGFRKKRDAG